MTSGVAVGGGGGCVRAQISALRRRPRGRRRGRCGSRLQRGVRVSVWGPRPRPARRSPRGFAPLTRAAADAAGGAAAAAPARLLARLAGRRQVVLLLAAQRLGGAHEAAQLVPAADAGPEAAPFAPGAAGEALGGGTGGVSGREAGGAVGDPARSAGCTGRGCGPDRQVACAGAPAWPQRSRAGIAIYQLLRFPGEAGGGLCGWVGYPRSSPSTWG
jgi:hypothetical protein